MQIVHPWLECKWEKQNRKTFEIYSDAETLNRHCLPKVCKNSELENGAGLAHLCINVVK